MHHFPHIANHLNVTMSLSHCHDLLLFDDKKSDTEKSLHA